MIRLRRLPLTLLALLAITLSACGQAAPATPTLVPTPAGTPEPTPAVVRNDAELVAKLDEFLGKISDDGLFKGIVSVRRNGALVYQQGHGFADREREAPFTPDTIFPIGEMTLQFTAAATLLLEQQGKLKVEDSVCQYLADCPDAWAPVTIHHLLSHTSGIPDYTNTSQYRDLTENGATPDQIVALFRDKPLDHEPGAARTYSHSGFVLLGLVIERASGQSYGDFMSQAVFEPLGMSRSSYGTPVDTPAIGYYSNGPRPTDPFDVSALYSSGGLFSTSADMLRWNEALHGGGLLDQERYQKMMTNHMSFGDNDVFGSGYGIVLSTFEGYYNIGQCGGILGFGGCLVYYPNAGITTLILTNQDDVDTFTLGEPVDKLSLGIS